jgi:hypothetical protein
MLLECKLTFSLTLTPNGCFSSFKSIATFCTNIWLHAIFLKHARASD